MSDGVIITLANLTMQIPGISSGSNTGDVHAAVTTSLPLTSFGFPLTGIVGQLDLLLDLSKDDNRVVRFNFGVY